MAEKKIKVLCIEDEPQMIDLIRLILESKGYEVIGAEGGREGLELMRGPQELLESVERVLGHAQKEG